MNLLKFPNFISDSESQELSNWILQNKNTGIFQDADMRGSNRITTRYATGYWPLRPTIKEFAYPKIVKETRTKIVNLLDLHEEERNGIYPPFKDGVIASCAFPGDICRKHTDPIWYSGFHTMHCNVITQTPDSGGDLILNGAIEPMKEKELVCYLVSKTPHSTTLIEGTKERLMWIFGFCINDSKWNTLSEKY
jgi:hypothetical protein